MLTRIINSDKRYRFDKLQCRHWVFICHAEGIEYKNYNVSRLKTAQGNEAVCE